MPREAAAASDAAGEHVPVERTPADTTVKHVGGRTYYCHGKERGATHPTRRKTVAVGRTVLLRKRTRARHCRLGRRPDRRCSPGAFYSKLTKRVICSRSFRTSQVRHVTYAMRYRVEREYGLKPGHYGRRLEIDHIVPLELGGSNALANLFPERNFRTAGYHVKDRLENRLHRMVCSGHLKLQVAQRAIAANWRALYRHVFAGGV